jgi:hypothetical protein
MRQFVPDSFIERLLDILLWMTKWLLRGLLIVGLANYGMSMVGGVNGFIDMVGEGAEAMIFGDE